MEEITVSVLCAAFDHERYIRDALEGFVAQKTTFPFEVIIRDDASHDATADIIREYEKKYPGLIRPIYEKENQHSKGVKTYSESFFPHVRGRYMAICEGDDYWTDPFKLQKQIDYMEQHPDCTLSAHEAVKLNVRTGEKTPYHVFQDDTETLTAEQIIGDHLLFPTASMVIRTSCFREHLAFLQSVPNYDYVLKIICAAFGEVHLIREVMSVYRIEAVGSWTEHARKDTAFLEKSYHTALDTLHRIDDYTGRRFHEAIEKNCLKRGFSMKIRELDLAALKKEPYAALYRALPLKKRIALHVKKGLTAVRGKTS